MVVPRRSSPFDSKVFRNAQKLFHKIYSKIKESLTQSRGTKKSGSIGVQNTDFQEVTENLFVPRKQRYHVIITLFIVSTQICAINVN